MDRQAQLRQLNSDSGTFFTTEWGSPCEVPAGSGIAGHILNRQSHSDISGFDESLSQLSKHQRTRKHTLPPIPYKQSGETPKSGRTLAEAGRQTRAAPLGRLPCALAEEEKENLNWFSDDSDTGVRQGKRTADRKPSWGGSWLDFTPPKKRAATSRQPSATTNVLADSAEASVGHRHFRSDATITQEAFDDLQRKLGSPRAEMLAAMMQGAAMPRRRSSAAEKPLPPAPLNETTSESPRSPTTSTTTGSSHTRGTRTSISSVDSYPRHRARKTWRGKACWIAIPVADDWTQIAGIKEPLSPAEVQKRVRQWEEEGFSNAGFDIQGNDRDDSKMPGQSRNIYPDPQELHGERQRKDFRVEIPDKAAWDNYVRQLREEKLRALGVTQGDEDSSVSSPPMLAMSRQTSMQNSKASSSIAASQSAGGFRSGRESTFSPPLTGTSAHIPRPTSMIQPAGPHQPLQLGNHYPKQSVAFPGDFDAIHGPPFQPQPTPPLSGPWPQQYLGSLPGSRGVSPLIDGRPIRSTHSPISPLPDHIGDGPYSSHSPFIPPTHQTRDQPLPSHQQLPQSYNPLHRQISDILRAEDQTQPLRFISQPEIASPLPQGHRHNLSETLQKEIDDAEQHLEESVQRQLEDEEAKPRKAKEETQSAQYPSQPAESTTPEENGPKYSVFDIETNPIVTTSPKPTQSEMLLNADAAVSRRSSVSKIGSKLNADAPEFKFDPSKASFTSIFTFENLSVSSPQKQSGSVDDSTANHSKALSTTSTVGSNLNVAAPAFTPGQFHVPSEAKREFSFTSAVPVLKPDAPSFAPGSNIDRSAIGGEPTERPRIFANFKPAEVIQPPKKSRAVPIVKPHMSESENDAGDMPEDESGRITRAEGTQKRMRRAGGSGDQIPLFATPSREVSIEPPALTEETKPTVSMPDTLTHVKRSSTPGSIASPIEAATDQPRELVDDTSVSANGTLNSGAVGSESDGRQAASVEQDKPVDASISPLTPESVPPRSPEPDKTDHYRELENHIPLTSKIEPVDTKPAPQKASSLSATAKPFEFNPNSSTFNAEPAPSSVKAMSDKSPATAKAIPGTGLERSKHAAPEAGLEASKLAPPEVGLEGSKSATPAAGLGSSKHAPPEPLSPAESTPNPRDQEESLEARIASGVHYVEAPSYQEIDDVMQQLNGDDSDLGVERNLSEVWRSPARSAGSKTPRSPLRKLSPRPDSPGSDPFLEAVRPQRAVSASPNRLQEPFQYLPKQDTESSGKADALADLVARNARFSPSYKRPRNPAKELDSPVRRVGRPRNRERDGNDDRSISEWDDVVSSDEELGFRARTGFFDNRVHELLDGVVDNRLRPLEQSLATINATLVRMNSGRSRSRGVRRSTSAEVESDADDEDDETAAAAARQYSPIRDRKLEKLKASLLETINSQKSAAPQEELSKMSQELLEVRAAMNELKNQPSRSAEPHAEQYNQLLDAMNELKASIPAAAQASAHNESTPREVDAEIVKHLAELKDLLRTNKHQSRPSSAASENKPPTEGESRKQSRGKSAPITYAREAATVDKLQLQVDGLESMLKVADSRVEDHAKARQEMEAELEETRKLLKDAQLEAAQQRESAEETEESFRSFLDRQQEAKHHAATLEEVNMALEQSISELTEKSAALEETLEEYRISHDNWREEIDTAKTENENLERTIHSLKTELEDGIKSRGTLKEKLAGIQNEMVSTTRAITTEQASWRQKIEEHKAKLEHQTARLEAEARTRERLELEIDRLEKQEKEAMKSRFLVEQIKEENNHLVSTMHELRTKNHHEQEKILSLERELHDVKESNQLELQRAFNSHKGEMATTNQQTHLMRANFEAIVARLESQVEHHKNDVGNYKQRYELMLEEASISKDTALREAAEAREAALQEHYRFHERSLEETRASHEKAAEEMKDSHQQAISKLVADHERALSNVIQDQERAHTATIEDKKATENSLNGRLVLADEKISHYQDRVAHLEERLEIAKSAAAAAAAAAARSGKGLSSTTTANSGSVQVAPGSNIPEKISPQALRESIMVLQEQLRDRENQIEKLDSDFAKVDHDAPKKIKDRDFEISWLRELLGVRLDDLQDIVTALAMPSFDRESVRNAAIRLRANMEMEQQEKERAMAGGSTFPSLASITASPRSLPLAAAAAWGNWRKGKTSVGGLAEMSAPNGSASRTPSRASPQSFLSGLLTPPNTQVRPSPGRARGPARQIPTGSAPGPSRGRPAYGYSTPRRQISNGQPGPARASEPSRQQAPPETPTLLRTASYDRDAESTHYSLDRYVAAADEDEVAVGLDEESSASPEGEPIDELNADNDTDQVFGPSIELES